MSDFLPKEVMDGLRAAHLEQRRKSTRLRVAVGQEYWPIHRSWDGGFAVEAGTVPPLRGLVDIHSAGKHLYQCLIVASELEGDEMRYEFKRNTQATDTAPLDFYRAPDAPIALLGRES